MEKSHHVAIVGGGIAGLYAAYRLKQAWQSQPGKLRKEFNVPAKERQLRVVIFEANPLVLGGRIRAAELPFPGGSVRAELGAMRITTRHLLARHLFAELGVRTTSFEGRGFSEHYFLRGKHFDAGDVELGNKKTFPYGVDDAEKGKTPGALVKHVLEQTLAELSLDKDATPDTLLVLEKLRSQTARLTLTHAEWCDIQKHGLLTGRVHLNNIGMWNLIHHYLSPEAASFVEGGFGYESIIGNWNVSDAIPWFIGDFSPGQSYEAIEGSFFDVVVQIEKKLISASGEFQCKIVKNAHVTGLSQSGGRYSVSVEVERKAYQRLVPIPKKEDFSAAAVFLALPRRSLEDLKIDWLEGTEKEKWLKHLASVRAHRLVKIVQGYRDAWWRSDDARPGASRTFTDLPLRQVYYFDRQWLDERGRYRDTNGEPMRGEKAEIGALIVAYLDGHYASFWRFITAVQRIRDLADPSHEEKDLVEEAIKNAIKKEQQKRTWFGRRVWAWPEPPNLDDLYTTSSGWSPSALVSHLYFNRYGLYERASLKVKHTLDLLHKPAPGTHGARINVPEPVAGAYTFWDDHSDDKLSGAGWHTWEPGVTSADAIKYMRRPFKGHNVYVCGEAYSSEQGWIEGALKSVEVVLDHLEILVPNETDEPNAPEHVQERSEAMRDHIGLERRQPKPPPVSDHMSVSIENGSEIVFLSGKIGFTPPSPPDNTSLESQTIKALDDLLEELRDAKRGPADLVSVRVFLRTMNDYDRFNRIYAEKMVAKVPPVRTAIAVRDLPFGALVEVDGIAVLKPKR